MEILYTEAVSKIPDGPITLWMLAFLIGGAVLLAVGAAALTELGEGGGIVSLFSFALLACVIFGAVKFDDSIRINYTEYYAKVNDMETLEGYEVVRQKGELFVLIKEGADE